MKLNGILLAFIALPASFTAALPISEPTADISAVADNGAAVDHGAVARGVDSEEQEKGTIEARGRKTRVHNGKKQYWSEGSQRWKNDYNGTPTDKALVGIAEWWDEKGGKEKAKEFAWGVVKDIAEGSGSKSGRKQG